MTTRSKPRPASGPRTTLAHRLDAAAVSLTAGRDLLQSHLGLAPDGTREYRTDWAPPSPRRTRRGQCLTEIASLSRQAAAQGAQLAITPGWRGSPDARRRLSTACQWAWILDAAVRVADRKEPLREADRELLRTIPVSVLPPYRQPEPDESVQDLCQGIREAGERLRRASWASARDAVWSPWSTVTALRIVAAASTVTSHNSQAVLHDTCRQLQWLARSGPAHGSRSRCARPHCLAGHGPCPEIRNHRQPSRHLRRSHRSPQPCALDRAANRTTTRSGPCPAGRHTRTVTPPPWLVIPVA